MHRHFVELTNHCTAYSCALFNLRRMDHELGATALSCSLVPLAWVTHFECLALGDSFYPLAWVTPLSV